MLYPYLLPYFSVTKVSCFFPCNIPVLLCVNITAQFCDSVSSHGLIYLQQHEGFEGPSLLNFLAHFKK